MKETMKIGAVAGCYGPPKELEGAARYEWVIRAAAADGLQALGVPTEWLEDEPERAPELGALAREHGIELEAGAFREIFGLVGPESKATRAALLARIELARALGARVLRTGYGHLTIETSRFNKQRSLAEHIRVLRDPLQEAARIMEDNDMLLAVENHCDFTGRELAELLCSIDSPRVGAALDTGNGFTVFTHPHDDIAALAPLTITTHIKDMKIVDDDPRKTVCFAVVGCALGEGHVDFEWAIEQLAHQSPHAEGLPLIIEYGWLQKDPTRNYAEQRDHVRQTSVQYLRELVGVERVLERV